MREMLTQIIFLEGWAIPLPCARIDFFVGALYSGLRLFGNDPKAHQARVDFLRDAANELHPNSKLGNWAYGFTAESRLEWPANL